MSNNRIIVKIADKETMDKLYKNTAIIAESFDVKEVKRYGLKIDKNDSNPETRCTYIFDAEGMMPASMNFDTGIFEYGDWKNVFFVKNNYPAMVRYDGTEEYKLDPENYAYKTDGTESDVSNITYEGNAMSVFDGTKNGKIWLSQYEDENYEYMIVSNTQYDETFSDDAYIRDDGSHADKLYYPMFGGSTDGERLRSLAGQNVAVDIGISTCIEKANANGSGWTIGSWSKRNLINCLLKILAKSDNGNAVYGRGQAAGYISNASRNYGHIETGTLKNKGQFFGYDDDTHEVKIFHMEKWWGNCCDAINGMLIIDGKIMVKMRPPYNLTGDGYTDTGITVEKFDSGWIKDTKSGIFGRIPKSLGGSSSTYVGAKYIYNKVTNVMSPFVGGKCDGYGGNNIDYLDLAEAMGIINWGFGASVYLD